MIELKECCKVPFPEKLFEKYEVTENAIYANVSTTKVLDMMKHFISIHNEPLFFILEIPCAEKDNITESKTLFNTNNDYEVYFIDGLNSNQACKIIDELGEILLNDGMNTFGIGGHESHEEILLGKYNVMTIYTRNSEKYQDFLNNYHIEPTDKLITAWDTFDREHFGECTVYVSKKNGKCIYDIPEMYKEYGMYLYETRKENNELYEKEITFEDLIGKVLLVNITYYTNDNELIGQKQFYGTVTEANETVIAMKQKDSTVFNLPPDLSSTKRARPGEYKLLSTGEVVTNPDFLASWNVIKSED